MNEPRGELRELSQLAFKDRTAAAEIFAQVADSMPREELVPAAVALVEARHPAVRARALPALRARVEELDKGFLRLLGLTVVAGGLEGSERQDTLEGVLDQLDELESEEQAEILGTMALFLPDELRPAVFQRLDLLEGRDRLPREHRQRIENLLGSARPLGPGSGSYAKRPGLGADSPVLPSVLPRSRRETLPALGGLSVEHRGKLATAAVEALSGDWRDAPYRAPSASPAEHIRQMAQKAAETPERVVSTGFSAAESPEVPRDRELPLEAGGSYWFWFELGPEVAGSVEEEPTGIDPSSLPVEAVLTVALFPLGEGLLEEELSAATAYGELKLCKDGSAQVLRQPAVLPAMASEVQQRRLFFPVDAAAEEGTLQFRCGIYHRQALLQSRLVQARVAHQPRRGERALTSKVDFLLSRSLAASHVGRFPEHRLSLLSTRMAGRQSFSFWGGEGTARFHSQGAVDASSLQSLIDLARQALRRVCWGSREEWNQEAYRYRERPSLAALLRDLAILARAGYKLYDAMIGSLAGGEDRVRELDRLMSQSGMVQIAVQDLGSQLVPASMLYSHPLDTGWKLADHRLCPVFEETLKTAARLESSPCFQGECPCLDVDDRNLDRNWVCPSGFWGFRHGIGLPLSVGDAPDAPPEIPPADGLTVAACVYPDFQMLARHEEHLRSLRPGLIWRRAADRRGVIRLLKSSEPQLVYFYCHGGESHQVPYLVVGKSHGPGPSSSFILPENLRGYGIRWPRAHPLVFLNGCHTTALRPQQALQFVRPLVSHCRASGVVGTEITVFEPLATRFAESCLRHFLVEEQPLGEAVRQARLDLLQEWNPLGLVYIPFAPAGLRMAEG